MNTIECRALTKRYGAARGVEDLSFGIEKGEVFGYLGPNGSGKTTTIRCLMGLLAPTSGLCRILGAPVVPGQATGHARIGYLPGDFRIWPQYTARQSLRFMAALGDGNDAAERRRNELADRLDLNLDRRIGALSKGNRQKVGVIYALQHRPDLLILDEPTIGLDPLISQIVLDLIREASESGATVLLSSHDLAEVAAICGRAAILREGRLVELAPVSQIVRQGERRLKVWFVKGALVPALPADRLPGVRVISQDADSLHVAYQGTAEAVLKWIADFPVDRIATPQTSLQEAFMQYYQKEAGR
ncbi:MAG: ABC transporter ATP-binding protein [Sedimentisphaerales bacterium]|nr:ABC transporter ATP-binding protein [Sedimentisphaerales bacterium]